MNTITFNTPALLFPTVSLLLLAYTNRYVAISNRIRILYAQYKSEPKNSLLRQIQILKKRIRLIRNMQLAGIMSIFFAAFTMLLLFFNFEALSFTLFGISLLLMLASLFICAIEIYLSDKALFVQIEDIDEQIKE